MMKHWKHLLRAVGAFACVLGFGETGFAQTTVWTQHMDNWRSGWNLTETALNPQDVSYRWFEAVSTTPVDGTVNAQPLVEPAQQINCLPNQTVISCKAGLSGTYQVVYVATENNSLYAIDASTGNVLLQRNFTPVGATGGIQETPVIDVSRGTIIFVSYSVLNAVTTLTLHELNLADLSDNVAAVNLTSNITGILSDGSTYAFDPNLARSKSGLLLANGAIYIPIAAQDETNPAYWGKSRGWVLRFSPVDLSLLGAFLTDSRATSANNFFISSIWMSRAAPAADGSPVNANIYFLTGNSDKAGNSYDPVYNLEESAVELSQNLGIVSSFTPSNYGFFDTIDLDFGSGGVLKVPTGKLGPTNSPFSLVVGGGKDGRLFLLNAANMGGFTPGGPDNVLDVEQAGPCWCSPSYFLGNDGIGRVISSGGNELISWKIITTATTAKLVKEASATVPSGQNSNQQGFFTSISSNGPGPHVTGVIWAVARPVVGSNVVNLYAFNAVVPPGNTQLQQVGMWPAGVWNQHNNAVIVPVVANSKVFVASDGVLTIFAYK